MNIVNNNFPWPNLEEKQRNAIETALQSVLTTRASYRDDALPTNPLTIPKPLPKSHNDLDKAVWKSYRANWKSEADLMGRYRVLADNNG